MAESVISVEQVYKQYRLGVVSTGTISHDLNRWWYRVRGKEDPYEKVTGENTRDVKDDSEYVWALQDISFEVPQGEVLGIIGKNGAGKSTLLKILSKVTYPTKGQIKVKGRIASLLEVGTGFHPELTGRENVFLNGAILGMTKTEIKSKFDEIVAFSGVEKYIDTPVKRYSSGMYVRLAFAVAAHLEPEILIVDEVLAVGDAEFQKKCLGKMKDVSDHGRTVLFVSHNMAAVKSLCTQAVMLENGRVKRTGEVDSIVNYYLGGDGSKVPNPRQFPAGELGTGRFWINAVGIKAGHKPYGSPIGRDDTVLITINYSHPEAFEERLDITLRFKVEEGICLFNTSTLNSEIYLADRGTYTLTVVIPAVFFQPGTYFLDLLVVANRNNSVVVEEDILTFTIIPDAKKPGGFLGKSKAYLSPRFDWQITPELATYTDKISEET